MNSTTILRATAACFFIALLFGCKKDSSINEPINKSINGSVQKGPFNIGSSVTFYELDANYSQTGKAYSAEIVSGLGDFSINDISLVSPYVSVKADGFYFNEVCGSNSISQLTLHAISDLSSSSTLHLNVLTQLEKQRVEYLLAIGLSFDSAKKTAQADVLDIFNINSVSIQNSEYLDVSSAGNGNAILLAVSSIVQGFRNESELSSLMSLISNDISSDGTLNNTTIMSSLIDHAVLLDTISIRNNLTNYYLSLGITPSIPQFEFYIQHFINNTSYSITNSVINYPATGLYGDNILYKNQLSFNGSYFSMKANLKKCSQFKIRVHVINSPNLISPYWITDGFPNWNITPYDTTNHEQFFSIIDPTLSNSDLSINIPITSPSTVLLIEYFEVNLSTPSFSKTITIN